MSWVPALIVSVIVFILIWLSLFLLPNLKIKNIKIPTYWIPGLLGAIAILCIGYISKDDFIQSFSFSNSSNPLKIIILFISVAVVSTFLDSIGFFRFIAYACVKRVHKSPFLIFTVIYLLAAVLTAFTSNDIVILTFVPFICYFCKALKIKALPFLIGVFVAANTWSMLLLIGNPTNIYLATTSGITFSKYFSIMWLPTIVSGVVEYGILLLLFRKDLFQDITFDDELIDNQPINKIDTIIGVSALLIDLILFVVSSYVQVLEMWITSLSVAVILIIYILFRCIKNQQARYSIAFVGKNVPWFVIVFILTMFIIVLGLKNSGISANITKILGEEISIISYGGSSTLLANFMNNIPMSMFYSTICNPSSNYYMSQVFSSIIGSNIGAFLTPIGALAGIMFFDIVKKNEIELPIFSFIKYGFIIAVPTLAAALGMLYLICK